MLEHIILLFGSLTGVLSRDTRPVKPMPTISNSLVNFGKMDISFYLNDKFKDALSSNSKQDAYPHLPSSFFSSQLDSPVEEPCPCSSLRNMKDPIISHPSEILNKVLMSNDLFSYNKELISSTLCCDSHENVHDEGIFFEFSPKQNQVLANPMQASQLLPSLARFLENTFPKLPTRPIQSTDTLKSQAIDIYLYPKKTYSKAENTDSIIKKKPDIHAVGDNKMIKDMKTINLTPVLSNKSSVKKDLGKKNIEENKISISEPKIVNASTNYPNSV